MKPAIESVAEPVVGRIYDVPLAEYELWSGKRIVPIIGDVHSDNQFGVKYEHYHIDGRFVGKRLAPKLNMVAGHTNMIVRMARGVVKLSRGFRCCARLETGISPPETSPYKEWYHGFTGHSCKGNRCPHLGTPMLKHGSGSKCPLHGLKANVAGLIVPLWESL